MVGLQLQLSLGASLRSSNFSKVERDCPNNFSRTRLSGVSTFFNHFNFVTMAEQTPDEISQAFSDFLKDEVQIS
jgi:hypothetical protein